MSCDKDVPSVSLKEAYISLEDMELQTAIRNCSDIEEVVINTEFIKLGQLLKLSGIISQGSDVKHFIGEGLVSVNGVVASERGKKIRNGDVVEVKEMGKVKVICEG